MMCAPCKCAAVAALWYLALITKIAVEVRAGTPRSRYPRRLQVASSYAYTGPAPAFPAVAPIPPAPIVLRPLVAPLIQGTLWRMHNGLAAASNSLLGTGIPYAGPLDTNIQVAYALGSPSIPPVDFHQEAYRDQKNFLYESSPNAVETVNLAPVRDPLGYDEALRQAAGDYVLNPYKVKSFPLPVPHNADYTLMEQQHLQFSQGGQPQPQAVY